MGIKVIYFFISIPSEFYYILLLHFIIPLKIFIIYE